MFVILRTPYTYIIHSTKLSAGTAFPALTPLPLNGRDYTYVLAGYFNDAARVHANPVEAWAPTALCHSGLSGGIPAAALGLG